MARSVALSAALSLCAACGSSSNSAPDGGGTGDETDAGHDAGGPVPAGDRRFGVEVDQPEGFDHGEELARAQAIGSSAVQITFPWKTLEPDEGQRDLEFLTFALGYYRDRGASVLLSVPTIDTVEKMFPADLMELEMDDPEVVARLEDLLDDILAVAGDELTHLVIGNEVDVYLGPRPDAEWDAYGALVAAATDHVNQTSPAIEVGLSITFGGLAGARVGPLTEATDVRYVTYYFIGNDFGGTPADNVAGDLAEMVAFAGDKPLVLKEFGYPTGDATGGSEAGQVEFVRETFAAWDQHPDALQLIMFSIMFDRSRTWCEETAAYYGFPDDEAFIQFLCTLGLRSVEGDPKPGWDELALQSELRGF
jgi:hypothetical protein